MATKAAADFESAMREVNTMMGLTEDDFKAFSGEVEVLATGLGVDAVESAKALYQAISAGVPKDNAIEFLRIATEAAIGGITSTEVAVDGLSTVINAFKLPLSDTQRVADLMFQTVKGGKTTFEELSAALFNVAPIAAASGVSFDEVSAALATMTKQGVPTKIATTQLRQAMVTLQKPTEDMNKVIKDLGYESGQTMLEELGLAEALNQLRDATGGSNEKLMKMFGSVEAGAAVLSLTGDNAQMFAADLDAMAQSEGAATAAFQEMEKSASRQMEALKNSAQGVAISIGNVLLPVLTDLLGMIKPIIQGVIAWSKEHPSLTKVIVAGTAGIRIPLSRSWWLIDNAARNNCSYGSFRSYSQRCYMANHFGRGSHCGSYSRRSAALDKLGQSDSILQRVVDQYQDILSMREFAVSWALCREFTKFIPGLNELIDKAKYKLDGMIDAQHIQKEAYAAQKALEETEAAIVDVVSATSEATKEAIEFTDALFEEKKTLLTLNEELLITDKVIDKVTGSVSTQTKEVEELAEAYKHVGEASGSAWEGNLGDIKAGKEQYGVGDSRRPSLTEYLGSKEGREEIEDRMREGGGSKKSVIGDMQEKVYGFRIPGYQMGTWNVPKTGPAMVHKGEAIIPAGKAVNIYVELDGRVIGKAIGAPLVDEIRLRTGVKV